MKIKLITIPILEVESGNEQVNNFTASKKIIKIDRTLIQDDGRAYWCFCIEYLDSQKKLVNSKTKPNYKEELTPTVYKKFEQFRKIRTQLAKDTGNPPYLFFTDAELIQMAKLEHLTVEEMLKIKGIGRKKVEKYAAFFIENNSNEKSQSPHSKNH